MKHMVPNHQLIGGGVLQQSDFAVNVICHKHDHLNWYFAVSDALSHGTAGERNDRIGPWEFTADLPMSGQAAGEPFRLLAQLQSTFTDNGSSHASCHKPSNSCFSNCCDESHFAGSYNLRS
jgi:hypothetical protein